MAAAASLVVTLLAALAAGASAGGPADSALQLEKMKRETLATDLSVDLSSQAPADRAALAELVKAADVIDGLFMRQQWSGELGMLRDLAGDESPSGRERLAFFLRMKGPWDRRDGDKPFVAGAPPVPVGGDLYPADVTKEELSAWFARLPVKSRESAMSPLSAIRWLPGGGLESVPYSVLYENQLADAARHLRLAAGLTTLPALKAFLLERAEALSHDDFSQTDAELMSFDAPIVADVGPFGIECDRLFANKAAYGAIVVIRDDSAMALARRLSRNMPWLLTRLPAAFEAADGLAGVPPVFIGGLLVASGAADVAPNSQLAISAGPKARMFIFDNVVQAQVQATLPFARALMDRRQARDVGLDGTLANVTMSQLLASAGFPKTASGPLPPPQQAPFLQLDLARQTVSGPWGIKELADKGVLDKSLVPLSYASYVAGILKLARAGGFIGQTAAIQVNFLLGGGGLAIRDGRFTINEGLMKQAMAGLIEQILDIEVRGDAAAAQALSARLGTVRPDVAQALSRTRELPVDIGVRGYPAARSLAQAPAPDLTGLEKIKARSAVVDLSADYSALSQQDRTALAEIVRAAQGIDPLFMEQQWSGELPMLAGLAPDRSPAGRAQTELFLRMAGPWDRLDESQSFIPGAPPLPEGADFYPSSASAQRLETWLNGLSSAAKESAESFATVIRDAPGGGFVSVPYSTIYQSQLSEAAAHLHAAAQATSLPGLKTYLERCADAFRLNDFYGIEEPLMKADEPILASVGPDYPDVDGLLGLKSAFGAVVAVRDDAEAAKFRRYRAAFGTLEGRLPTNAPGKAPDLPAPLLFAGDLIFASGGAVEGWISPSLDLPGIPGLAKEGERRPIILRNVVAAETDAVIAPAAKRALASAERRSISSDARMARLAATSLVSGLRPSRESGGSQAALKDYYRTVEDLRLRSEGLWAAQQLVDQGAIDKALERGLYADDVANDLVRARIGRQPFLVELDYLLDRGALRVEPDGRLTLDLAKAKEAEASLLRETSDLETKGGYADAQAFVGRFAKAPPALQKILERLDDLPTSVWPRFVSAKTLLSQN